MENIKTVYDQVIATRSDRRRMWHDMLWKLADGVANTSGLDPANVQWVDVERKRIGSIDFVVTWGPTSKSRDLRATAALKLVLTNPDPNSGFGGDAIYVTVGIIENKKGESLYKIEGTTIPSAAGLEGAVNEVTKAAASLIEKEFSH